MLAAFSPGVGWFSHTKRGTCQSKPCSPPQLGVFPCLVASLQKETGLAAAAGRVSAFRAGCFMPQRFPFLIFLMPTFAKLEWANTCC